MIRRPIVFAILIGITSLGVFVSGQLAAQDATGTISGRISYDRLPEVPFEGEILIVPADVPQPIPFLEARQYFLDFNQGHNFSIGDLEAGEYLVGFFINPDYVPSLPEMIVVLDDRENDLGLRQTSLGYPALRVQVPRGRTVTLDVPIHLPVFTTVEPITNLPGLARGAGSISGRIYLESCDSCRGQFRLVVIPVGLGRALDLTTGRDTEAYEIGTDIHGFYTVTDIADGDYLVAPPGGGREYATSFSEKVTYTLGTKQADLPARRVVIANGEAVTGVDFLFKEPRVFHSDSGLPATQEDGISGLPAGQGDDITLATVASYIGVGIAALTVLALAGGVALRVRGSRPR